MQFPTRLLRAGVALAIAGVLCLSDAARRVQLVPALAHSGAQIQGSGSAQALDDAAVAVGHWERTGHGHIPMPQGVPTAHASALLALPVSQPSALLAFWFAGDRESAPNVQIAMSALDRASGNWSPARMVLDRWDVAAQLGFGIRRLGNPVAWLDNQGRVHLFVVATGLGGWAAGRVVHMQQTVPTPQAPWAWRAVAVLPLSWLWNTSYLVRTAPLPLADGGLVLPAYFELARKYPVALRLDSQGVLLGMAAISTRGPLLQPALLAMGERDWLAFMRDGGPEGRIRLARTRDGGDRWADAGDLALDNPDASVATLTAGAQHLMVYNPQKTGRNRLRMVSSTDGSVWSSVADLENGSPGHEYSYPAMAMVDGQLWVSYTDQRQAIAWQRFVWVAQATVPSGKESP
jgi:hypothetical protein